MAISPSAKLPGKAEKLRQEHFALAGSSIQSSGHQASENQPQFLAGLGGSNEDKKTLGSLSLEKEPAGFCFSDVDSPAESFHTPQDHKFWILATERLQPPLTLALDSSDSEYFSAGSEIPLKPIFGPLPGFEFESMAPTPSGVTSANGSGKGDDPDRIGPHPSHIRVARAFWSEQRIREWFVESGVSEAKEDSLRLQGVGWIDNVRKELQLPVRTYNTACIYYHRFRLMNPGFEFNYSDASASALFTACKIEDTLKKSKEILCAAYNFKNPQGDRATPDDPMFDSPSKAVVGLERLMLEASAFDFRSAVPQHLVCKLAKNKFKIDRNIIGRTAFSACTDLYRTFVPLKQIPMAMAFASLELAGYLHGQDIEGIDDPEYYKNWGVTRAEVMDLLELYTHHRTQTIVGPKFSVDDYIRIRIRLNQLTAQASLPRYTMSKGLDENGHLIAPLATAKGIKSVDATSADVTATGTPVTASPSANGTSNVKDQNWGGSPSKKSEAVGTGQSTPTVAGGSKKPNPGESLSARRQGTERFMLDPERARMEKEVVGKFFNDEMEDVVVEVEEMRDI